MTRAELDSIVAEIKADETKSFKLTPRDLCEALGHERRTCATQKVVREYLFDNRLTVEPDYLNTWIDGGITLKHMGRATTKSQRDPVKKLSMLNAANRMPVYINNDAELAAATTLMMMHNFSQLPVVNNMSAPHPIGFISWETIGRASNGRNSENPRRVKDCVEKNVVMLYIDTPILDAINSIHKHDFIVVKNPDESMCGIVTVADIASQFMTTTEPFLLLEEIECHVRQILDGKLMMEELRAFCENGEVRGLESIDDLNFGDYINVMRNAEVWEKLDMSVDKKYFLKSLDTIREIRNDIMHFDPDGVSEAEMVQLRNMSKFLSEVGQGLCYSDV